MRSSGSEPVDACGRSSMDLNGSRRNPGGILLNGVYFGHPVGPFRPGDSVSLVFVCCPGQLFAPGVDFLDRILALATPLLLYLTFVRPFPGHTSAPGVDLLDRFLAHVTPLFLLCLAIVRSPCIGVRQDFCGCSRGSSLVFGLRTESKVRVLLVSSDPSFEANPFLGFFVLFMVFVVL